MIFLLRTQLVLLFQLKIKTIRSHRTQTLRTRIVLETRIEREITVQNSASSSVIHATVSMLRFRELLFDIVAKFSYQMLVLIFVFIFISLRSVSLLLLPSLSLPPFIYCVAHFPFHADLKVSEVSNVIRLFGEIEREIKRIFYISATKRLFFLFLRPFPRKSRIIEHRSA